MGRVRSGSSRGSRAPRDVSRRAFAALVAAAGLAAPRVALACAPAPPLGEWVRVASEAAIIVWDEAKKTEHFIRRASFRGTGKEFGFLVPTPARPELGEVDDHVFDALAWETRPRVERRVETGGVELASCFGMFLGATERSASAPAGAPVVVLEEARVAGYDAVVLEASDPSALASWLRTRGYAEGPSLTEWLRPYVERGWILTAFKVAAPGSAPPASAFGTQAVRMSFVTERPFFPYREPADQRAPLPPEAKALEGPRDLLVYLVAAQRMTASIGDSGGFPGSVPAAKRLRLLPPALQPLATGIAEPMLTVFSDPSTPRQGTDELFFSVSGEQSEVEPPPVVVVDRRAFPIPIEPIALVAAIGGALLVRRSRRGAG